MKAAFPASLGEFHGVLSHCDNEMTWPALLHSLSLSLSLSVSLSQKHICQTRVKMRKSYLLSRVS